MPKNIVVQVSRTKAMTKCHVISLKMLYVFLVFPLYVTCSGNTVLNMLTAIILMKSRNYENVIMKLSVLLLVRNW
jgi:hypothetical protein